MTARDDILARVRAALRSGPTPTPTRAPVPREYRRAGDAGTAGEPPGTPATVLDGLLDRFEDRLGDYRAGCRWATPDGCAAAVARLLIEAGIRRLVVPPGFPSQWLDVSDVELVDGRQATVSDLDAADGTVTTCAVAVAETGTVVLDAGPGMGRRALSLVPDHLLVVVRADQVVAGVPDALARLDATGPLTWISGPSATSDIELRRVEGVHGPRVLQVVLLGQATSAAGSEGTPEGEAEEAPDASGGAELPRSTR